MTSVEQNFSGCAGVFWVIVSSCSSADDGPDLYVCDKLRWWFPDSGQIGMGQRGLCQLNFGQLQWIVCKYLVDCL